MPAISLQYRGRLVLRRTGGETSSVLDTIHAPVASTGIEVTHTIAGDGSVEILEYLLDDGFRAVIYRDTVSCSFITYRPRESLTVQPLDEAGGLPALGYLQTPGFSSLIIRRPGARDTGDGDDGCVAATGCTNVRVPMFFDTKVYSASWYPSAQRVTASPYRFEGKPYRSLLWQVVPASGGKYARNVSYRETDARGGTIAEAEFTLQHVARLGKVRKRSDFIQAGADYLILKNHVGFGGAYDPNVRDEWAFYRVQERYRMRQEVQKTAPWGIISIGLLIVGALSFVLIRRIAPRWRRG